MVVGKWKCEESVSMEETITVSIVDRLEVVDEHGNWEEVMCDMLGQLMRLDNCNLVVSAVLLTHVNVARGWGLINWTKSGINWDIKVKNESRWMISLIFKGNVWI